MGRYYQTDHGREGKFMFGVQPSDDPQVMGMHEQDPTSVYYYADTDDEETIKASLDAQYDILGVPKEERIYYCKDAKEAYEYEKRVLEDKVWVSVADDDKETLEKYKDEVKWASDKEGYTNFEIKGHALVLARIRLGLDILSDIKDEGFCSLEAEL